MKLHITLILLFVFSIPALGAKLPGNAALEGYCPVCLVEMGKAGPGKAKYYSIHDERLYLFPGDKQKTLFDNNPDRYDGVGIAMEGHCPVCLYKGKLVKGLKEHRATYDARTYFFPSKKAKETFDADPEKYIPGLGGDCVVCPVEMGKSVPGTADYSLVYNVRLYLFPGQKQLDMFAGNPDKYTDADLALAGYCPVCLEKMNKLVQGKSVHAATHNGRRYLFPSEEQLRMFMGNPAFFTRDEVVTSRATRW